MSLKMLNTICYTVCIICIVAGVLLSLVVIWGEVHNEIAWRGFMTIAVFFLAAVLTLSVNRAFNRPEQHRN